MGRKGYPAEFRKRVLDLIASGGASPIWPGTLGQRLGGA